MSDEKPAEMFECLSCGELWKLSYAPSHPCPECDSNKVIDFEKSETNKMIDQNKNLSADNEKLILQLAACGVAALCNTPESLAKQIIERDNPSWSASYGDVISLVERDLRLNQELAELKERTDEDFQEMFRQRDAAVSDAQESLKLYQEMGVKYKAKKTEADHALQSVKMAIREVDTAKQFLGHTERCYGRYLTYCDSFCGIATRLEETIAKLKERHGL